MLVSFSWPDLIVVAYQSLVDTCLDFTSEIRFLASPRATKQYKQHISSFDLSDNLQCLTNLIITLFITAKHTKDDKNVT